VSRSSKAIIVCVVAVAYAVIRPQSSFAQNAPPQIPADVRAACASDVQSLCSGVAPGGGRIVACLKQHMAQVSDPCKQAVTNWMQQLKAGAGGGAGPATSPVPAPAVREDAGTTTSAPSSPAAHRKSQPSTTTAPGTRGNYLLMKQVKIIDPSIGQGIPAYDLLIPTTWQFQGGVKIGGAEGGCFADWFAVFGDAKSADKSIELQILPQYTWQYINDSVALRQMQAQNQSDARYGMKPCPVQAPMPAAEFIRQGLIAKYRKGKTVVSIDPYPELNQMVRSQLGLPGDAAGGGTSGIRTDAARARLETTTTMGNRSKNG
jgi:hypothetical protein